MYQDFLVSPVGILAIKSSDVGLISLRISNNKPISSNTNDIIERAKTQLDAYFKNQLNKFDITLDYTGCPPFYTLVWQALRQIPYGEVRTYQELAIVLNKPKAARAVGMANAKNPIAIIVPCHRVIGSDGSLTGYAYGNKIKAKLLKHEGLEKLSKSPDLFS